MSADIQAKKFVIGFVDSKGKVKKIISQKITQEDVGKDYELKIWADFVNDGEVGQVVDTIKIPIGKVGIPQKKIPIPNIAYSPSSEIKEGDQITLDGTGSRDPDGSIISYLWTGDNTIQINNSNQQVADFIYPVGIDQVNVSLTVADNDNQTANKSIQIKKGVIQEPTDGLVRMLFHADNDTNEDADKVNQTMIAVPNVSLYGFIGDGPYSKSGKAWVAMMDKSFGDKKQKLIFSRGNHDTASSESIQTQRDIEAWFPETKSNIGKDTWISSRIVGNVFVISMDTEDLDREFRDRDQFLFVKGELERATQLRLDGKIDWIVVLFHKPFFTLKSSHSPYTGLRFMYKDLFRAAQVDFCVSGHNHNTQLWLPMIPNESDANGEGSQLFSYLEDQKTFDFTRDHGALFIVTGHSAHEWNQIDDTGNGVKNVMHYRDSGEFGFTQIDFNGKKAKVQSIDLTGKIHYEYDVYRGENKPPEPKAVANFTVNPLRPLEGQKVLVDGRISKPSRIDGSIVTYTWSSPQITGMEFDPPTDFSNGSFTYPTGVNNVDLSLEVIDNDGLKATKTIQIRKFVQEPLNAEAELLINGQVGQTIILNGSKSTGPITRHEWLRESADSAAIVLEPSIGNWSDKFVATADMIGKNLSFRLRVYDAQGNFNDDVSGTKVTILNIPSGDFDSFGMKILAGKPTGNKKAMEEGTDHENGKRYNVNHEYHNYIMQGYFKLGRGQEKINHKGDGPNHGGCTDKKVCAWYELDYVLATGKGELQLENPHPTNNNIPDSACEFVKTLTPAKEGQWIGWATAYFWGPDGKRHIRSYVDLNPFTDIMTGEGKPLNNWQELVFAIEKGQIFTGITHPRNMQQVIDHEAGLESEIRMHRATNGDTRMKNVWVIELVPQGVPS